MAKEILSIDEEDLPEVIKVIREGLAACDSEVVAERLSEWCDAEEAYLESLGYETDDEWEEVELP